MIITYFLGFLLALGLVILPTGLLIYTQIDKELISWKSLVLSLVLGLWFIAVEAFVIRRVLSAAWFDYLLLIQAVVSLALLFKQRITKNLPRFRTSLILPLSIIILVTAINVFITFPSGTETRDGIRFAGVHLVDNTWHLALINSLQQQVPPLNPLYAGELIRNYHYLVDLQIATMSHLTHIPPPVIFFQLFGTLYIFLYCCLAYLLGKRIDGSRLTGIFAIMFLSLSSNWYYLAQIFYPGAYNWPSVAWVDYFSSKSVNYPLLFSMVIMLAVFYFLTTVKEWSKSAIIIISLLIVSLAGFKLHIAIVLISAISLLAILKIRQDKLFLKVFLLSFLGFGLIAASMVSLDKKTLILSPLWYIRVMYEAVDRLNFVDWELKRQYLLKYPGYLGLLKLYIQGLGVFFLINLGPLLIGLVSLLMKQLRNSVITLLMLVVSFFSVIYTMLFIYSGTAIVTIQFFYPAIIMMSLLLLTVLNRILTQRRVLYVIVAIIIWISLQPGVVYTLRTYSQYTYVDPVTSEGLSFLSKQSTGTILTDRGLSEGSLVPAYTNKSVFFTGEMILQTLLVDYSWRKQVVEDFFDCSKKIDKNKLLSEQTIKYIMTTNLNSCVLDKISAKVLLDNNKVIIYQVI